MLKFFNSDAYKPFCKMIGLKHKLNTVFLENNHLMLMPTKFIFLLPFVILSCKLKFEKKPDNLVSKDKMINLMADIHRTEGFVNNLNILSSDTSQFIYRKLEMQLFKKHNIDTSAYIKSFKYYLLNAEEFSEMYKEVAEIIKEKNKVDSLADAKLPKIKLDTTKIHLKNTEKAPKLEKLKRQKIKLDSLRTQNGKAKN